MKSSEMAIAAKAKVDNALKSLRDVLDQMGDDMGRDVLARNTIKNAIAHGDECSQYLSFANELLKEWRDK